MTKVLTYTIRRAMEKHSKKEIKKQTKREDIIGNHWYELSEELKERNEILR